MIRNILPILFLIIGIGLAGDVLPSGTNFDHQYKNYGLILNDHVKNGSVDYRKLKSNSDGLDLVLVEFAGVSREEFDAWDKQKQLAYLINLYNAATLDLVVDNYPLGSIKDIGKPWNKKIVNLHGDTISLNQLEHEIIRKNYKEPRIHFALVCAAKGCPVLISDAYVGSKLESQLDTVTKNFLSASDKNKIDDANQVIIVSPIFDWFADDFSAKSGSVVEFIAPYYSKNPEDLKSYQIKYTNYDWSLNDK
jgi:hypothetical protein